MSNNQPGKNEPKVKLLLSLMAILFFCIYGLVGVLSSQGSVYNIITITLAVMGTGFTFFQMLTSVNIDIKTSFPSFKFKPPQFHKVINITSPIFLLIVAVILLLSATINAAFRPIQTAPFDRCSAGLIPSTPNSFPSDTVVQFVQSGECIGISDGAFSFDTTLVERSSNYLQLKHNTLQELRTDHYAQAKALWETAHVTNDAEMLIYFEDQRVLDSHLPYINIVVAAMLTGTYYQLGRDELQGAYVAQREANSSCELDRCVQVRLLVANTSSGSGTLDRALNASTLANMIVQKETQYQIKGVMGWPFSGQTANVAQILGPSRIPMVSETASSDSLSSTSYFWRVVPPDISQAKIDASYALKKLQVKKVAVFYDVSDPYSRSLGEAFIKQILPQAKVIKEFYTIGKTTEEEMGAYLSDAFRQAPDLNLVYFSGYAGDASLLINRLPPVQLYPDLKLMGGDALYDTGSYITKNFPPAAFGRLYFSTFAYPDSWQAIGKEPQQFFCEYSLDFDPKTACPGPLTNKVYHYNRTSEAGILSYDATLILIKGSNVVIKQSSPQDPINFSPSDLQQALTQITGTGGVQGASGWISFGPDGNPLNKTVELVSLDSNGQTHMEDWIGCFLPTSCNNE